MLVKTDGGIRDKNTKSHVTDVTRRIAPLIGRDRDKRSEWDGMREKEPKIAVGCGIEKRLCWTLCYSKTSCLS